MSKPKLAVFVSDSPLHLSAIIDGNIPIDLVIADRTCRASNFAMARAIDTAVFPRSFGETFDVIKYTHEVTVALERHAITLIAMFDYGTVLAPDFFVQFANRVINIHSTPPLYLPSSLPSLPTDEPEFIGTSVYVETGEKDWGPVIERESLFVRDGDSPEVLSARLRNIERNLYTRVIRHILTPLPA